MLERLLKSSPPGPPVQRRIELREIGLYLASTPSAEELIRWLKLGSTACLHRFCRSLTVFIRTSEEPLLLAARHWKVIVWYIFINAISRFSLSRYGVRRVVLVERFERNASIPRVKCRPLISSRLARYHVIQYVRPESRASHDVRGFDRNRQFTTG